MLTTPRITEIDEGLFPMLHQHTFGVIAAV